MMNVRQRNDLVLEHQGLVYMVAKRFKHFQIDFLDLVQAGNEGLIIASRKYDPKRPTKFTTMAVWWIRKYVVNFVLERRLVHVPYQRQWAEIRRIQEDRRMYAQTGERSTTKSQSFETCELDENAFSDCHVNDEGLLIKELFKAANLTVVERDVLNNFYLNDLPFKDIAEHHRVSKQRICALHKRALSKIRRVADEARVQTQ